MVFGKHSRFRSLQQRRRDLQQNLRIEQLEHRRVFAGLSPVAVNDLYYAITDESLEVASAGVLANDSGAEGDTLTALEFRGPANGSLTLNGDGTFIYTPNPNFSGIDGFIYQVDDGVSRSHLAAVTIQVGAHTADPQAQDDFYTVAEDGLLGIGSTHGVLANDSGGDGHALQAVLGIGPTHGTLELNANGSFTYQPDANFNGIDTFTYQASDGMNLSELMTVEITVSAVNDVPQGANDTFATDEDQTLSVLAADGLLANDSDVDGDPLVAVLEVGPEHGTLELNADGSFNYTPNENFHGLDAFLYRVDDGTKLSELIVVEIMVNAVNDAPLGANDAYVTNEDEALTVPMEMGVLANDSDGDGDPLTVVLDVGPEHGTLELNADGSFIYTPDENYNGSDAFTYRASDGNLTSELIVVEIMVNAVNDAPLGANDAYVTNEDEALTVPMETGVLANDSDGDGDPLTAVLDVGPEHGTLELNADGSFTYTPDENYNGPDAFTYRASDGILTSELIVVEIMVSAVNDTPLGANDAYATNEDEALTVPMETGVLANDSDGDGDPLTAVLDVGTEHGTLELNADGSFTYTPDENYNGSDAFTYRGSDGTLTSELIVVEIMVSAVNDAPLGANDAYVTNEDEALTVPMEMGVLANDSDGDGDPLTVVLDVGPEHGTLELNADGSFTYTPDENYNGSDAFTYRASDGILTSELIVVEIMVSAVNDAPLGANEAYATNEDETLTVLVETGVLVNDSDVDGDLLLAVLDVGPAHGTLELNADGSFTYAPDENYQGPDAFTYRVSDGSLTSELLTVEIMVHAMNDAPLGGNDAYTVNEDEALIVTAEAGLLANDSDSDGDPLVAVLDVGPEHGTLELNSDGSFTYTPDDNYNGLDTFTYRASDGSLTSELLTVEIIVSAVNDAPRGVNDVYTTNEDETLTVAIDTGVLVNDSDGDGDPLVAVLNVGPKNGTLEFNADGSFAYTPDVNYSGVDAFTYQVSDGSETSELLVVEITVSPVNDAPTGLNDAYATNEDEALTIPMETGVLANDSDVDGDTLVAVLDVGPNHGSLELNADGSFTYTPTAGYHGTDAFTYTVSDGSLSSELIVVEITVNAVNDAPSGNADTYTVSEDETLTVPMESGLLANDSDPDGDSLSAVLDTAPEHGTLELNADGSFTYVPVENYHGPDTFSYRVSDGSLSSEVIVVAITVTAVNDAPFGQSDAYTVNEDETLTIPMETGVLGNDNDVDGDSLIAVLEDSPQHGTLELNADGSFTYVPAANYSGSDTFSYRVSDGSLSSDVITVEIMVAGSNDAPQAEDDAYIATVNETLIVPGPGVLANDTDMDGDTLSAILVNPPAHGQLTLAEDGSFVYQPDADFLGSDEFSYRASDGSESAVAVVSIRVRGVNQRPVAVNDVYQLDAGAEFNVAAEGGVLKNDSDGNQDLLGAVLFRGPQHGTLTLNSDGSFVYTPDAGFSGLDSFLYRAGDDELQSRLAAVTLRVKAIVQASQSSEVAPPSSLPTPEGEPVSSPGSLEEAFDSVIDSLAIEDYLRTEFEALLTAR